MKLFLHDPAKDLLVVSRDRVREFPHVAAAKDFLRSLRSDPRNRDALRGLTSEADGDLADFLVREGLVAVDFADERVEAWRASASDAQTPLEDEQAAQKPPPSEEEHFIEIELTDDEGNPRAGERYFVELPDGSTRSGRLDDQGKARVEGVEPGTAKVSFPDLDREVYGS